MTISEVKNMFTDQYADVEYYRNTFNWTHQIDFNMEHCTGVDACEVNDDMEAVSYQLADEAAKLLPILRIGMKIRTQKYYVFCCKKMDDRRRLWIKIL